MWTRHFWLSAAERCLKTFCQALVALLVGGDQMFGLVDVDWLQSLSIAGMAAVVSLLTSVASSGVGPDGSPSLVGEPPKEPEALLHGEHARDGVGRDGAPEMPVSLFDKPSAIRHTEGDTSR